MFKKIFLVLTIVLTIGAFNLKADEIKWKNVETIKNKHLVIQTDVMKTYQGWIVRTIVQSSFNGVSVHQIFVADINHHWIEKYDEK